MNVGSGSFLPWDASVSSSPVALVRWAGLVVLEFKGLSYPGPNKVQYLLAHHKAGPPISQFQPKPSYEHKIAWG